MRFLFARLRSRHVDVPFSFFWNSLTVQCVPPTAPSYSASHMIIFKSRAAYTMNIRLLCMLINPITHTHRCTAPSSR